MSLTGVHGDEDATRPDNLDVLAFEHEVGDIGAEGLQDTKNLLRHHRQHLYVDAVELVETAPRTGLSQACPQSCYSWLAYQWQVDPAL